MKRIRHTKNRELFLRALSIADQPLDLDQIHQTIQAELPKTAFSTVYRIAKQLELADTVTRVDWRERGSRYELTDQTGHHHHIVCTQCGRSADIDSSNITYDKLAIEAATGFRLNAHFINFEGTCQTCLDQTINCSSPDSSSFSDSFVMVKMKGASMDPKEPDEEEN